MSNETNRLQLSGGQQRRAARERLYRWVLFLCASLTVVVTLGIVLALTVDAVAFFGMVDPVSFFTGTTWITDRGQFGVLPLVTGTLLVTAGAAVVAIPVGVAAAVYLSEYASRRARSVLKPGLEILAGIPTVVYGYLALVYLTPFLRTLGFDLGTFNVASAAIMVGIMIIPMVSSLSEDAMSAVPDALRQAGYALGATKYEVSTGVVVPAAVSGIFASFILALSRAIGETMIVVMAMGLRPRLFDLTDPLSSLSESGQTMTSAMVQAVTSDVSAASPTYRSMFALGLTLFAITFLMNYLSNLISARYREEYR
ncbi:phosphate ABC transporter permease subunit PstC [Halorarum salinum]|uniref:Phosphate transport system permease protein n=1 Tax=Halorarum salinum TaxID=2743089 RepID=A0A7D5L8D6_9EURY|nr:phosphate ABC transporter permease subunit PstC [Halobaculum salinum]QLG60414.1 phosphate ABC transporter permease subunit PstC [Halobaculum salinum]